MFCPWKHEKTSHKSTINFVCITKEVQIQISLCITSVFIVLGINNFGFWLVGRAGNCAVTNYFYDSVLRFFAAILSLLNCSFMPRNSHHVRQSWQTTKASFHNGSVIVLKKGFNNYVDQILPKFDHLPSSSGQLWTSYISSTLKVR